MMTPTEPDEQSSPRVEFDGEVLGQIRRHARSSMNAEICGVLIGESPQGCTRITAIIEGEGAAQGGAHVTFTHATWDHIYRVKDERFPDAAIVGWYHSHPGFGIFLSDYDLFIHENFFKAQHQVAWVFDPHSDEEGCFAWQQNKVLPVEEFTVRNSHAKPSITDSKDRSSSSADPSPVQSCGKWKSMLAQIFRFKLSIKIVVGSILLLLLLGGLWVVTCKPKREFFLPLPKAALPKLPGAEKSSDSDKTPTQTQPK